MSKITETFVVEPGGHVYTYQVRALRVGTNQSTGWYADHFTTSVVPAPNPPDYGDGVVEAWPFYHLNAIFVFWTRVNRADLKFYRVYRSTEENADSEPIPPQKGDTDYIIAETSTLFHIDVGWDKYGVATAGSTGVTLKDSTAPFLANMKGERLWKIVDFETEYLVCNTDPSYNFGSIVSVQSSTSITTANKFWELNGSTWEKVPGTVSWASGDKYRIDYHPWRGTQYYYWVSVVTNSDVESELSEADGAKLGAPNDIVFYKSANGKVDSVSGSPTLTIVDNGETFYESLEDTPIYNITADAWGNIATYINAHSITTSALWGLKRKRAYWNSNDYYICGGTEDETKNFLFFKGWSVSWTCDDGAEAYWIETRLTTDTYVKLKLDNPDMADSAAYGIWSFPAYVPHVGAPEDVQTYGYPLMLVDNYYEFRVTAINNLIDKKCWSNPVTIIQRVIDTDAPDTITDIQVYSDIFGNTLYWNPPEATDVAYYEVYKSATTTPPSTPTAITPYWMGGIKGSYFDPGTGLGDEKRWYYWVASVDYHGNRSSLSDYEREGDFSKDRVLWKIDFIFGVFIFWNYDARDKYYKIYRSEDQVAGVSFTITEEKCIWGWDKKHTTPNFVDFGQCSNTTFSPPIYFPWDWIGLLLGTKKYYYKVEAYDKNSNMCGSSLTGIEANPKVLDVGKQTGGYLSADRITWEGGLLSEELSYINSNMITLTAVSAALPGMISSITITPQAITLASSGTITISSGRSLNITGTGKINLGSNCELLPESGGPTLKPVTSNTDTLTLGTTSKRWSSVEINTNGATTFSLGGNFDILTHAKNSKSQIRMNLPSTAGGAEKTFRSIWRDNSGYVRAS